MEVNSCRQLSGRLPFFEISPFVFNRRERISYGVGTTLNDVRVKKGRVKDDRILILG